MTTWAVQITTMSRELSVFTGGSESRRIGGLQGEVLTHLVMAGDEGVESLELATNLYGEGAGEAELKKLRVVVSELRARLRPASKAIARASTEVTEEGKKRVAVLRLDRSVVWIDYLDFLERARRDDYSVLPLFEPEFLPRETSKKANEIREDLRFQFDQLMRKLRIERRAGKLGLYHDLDPSERRYFWPLHRLTSPLDGGSEWQPAETLARPDLPLQVIHTISHDNVVCLHGERFAGRPTIARNAGAAASVRFGMDPIWIDASQGEDPRVQLGLRLGGKLVDEPGDIRSSLESEPDRRYLIIIGMESDDPTSGMELLKDIVNSQAKNLDGIVVTGPEMDLKVKSILPETRIVEPIRVDQLDDEQAIGFFRVLYRNATSLEPSARLIGDLRNLLRPRGASESEMRRTVGRSPIEIDRLVRWLTGKGLETIDGSAITKFSDDGELTILDSRQRTWLNDLAIFRQPFTKLEALKIGEEVDEDDWPALQPFLRRQSSSSKDLFEIQGHLLGAVRLDPARESEVWDRLATLIFEGVKDLPAFTRRREAYLAARPEVAKVVANQVVSTALRLRLVEHAADLWRISGTQGKGIAILELLAKKFEDRPEINSIRTELGGLLLQRSEHGDVGRAEEVLSWVKGPGKPDVRSDDFAKASMMMADIAYWNTSYGRSESFIRAARPDEGDAWNYRLRCKLGWVRIAESRFLVARDIFSDALHDLDNDTDLKDDPRLRADCLRGIGISCLRVGDLVEAEEALEKGIELTEGLSWGQYDAPFESGLIELARRRGNTPKAFEILDRSYTAVNMRRFGYVRGRFLQWKVRLLLDRLNDGDLEKAEESVRESAELLAGRRQGGDETASSPSAYLSARVKEVAGDYEGAAELFRTSATIAKNSGQKWYEARSCTALARVLYLRGGQDPSALDALADALHVHGELKVVCPDILASTADVAGRYAFHLDPSGKDLEALRALAKGLRKAKTLEELKPYELTDSVKLMSGVIDDARPMAQDLIPPSAARFVEIIGVPDHKESGPGDSGLEDRFSLAIDILLDSLGEPASPPGVARYLSAEVTGLGLRFSGPAVKAMVEPVSADLLFSDPIEIEVVRDWAAKVIVVPTMIEGALEFNRLSERIGSAAREGNGLGGVAIRRLFSLRYDELTKSIDVVGKAKPLAVFALFALGQR